MNNTTNTLGQSSFIRFIRYLWRSITHIHKWKYINDAKSTDVNKNYPPNHVDYISPKRWCHECGKMEWYVGPEISGGCHARWVALPLLTTDGEPN